MSDRPVQNPRPSTKNRAPQPTIKNERGEPHAVTQHRETFDVGPTLSSYPSEYAQIGRDVDLDKVVEPADLSSGPGHRIQVQGFDAPPPAVASFGSNSTLSYVNGVPPTEAQLAEERRSISTWDDVGREVEGRDE